MNIIDPTKFAAVTATEPSVLVSDKYSMASTANVLEVLRGHGWLPVGYNQRKAMSPTRIGKQAHAVLLANPAFADGETLPRILLKNSHDGTGSLQLLSGLYERICANGLVVGASAADVRITHRRITEDRIAGGILQTVSSLSRAIDIAAEMRRISLDTQQQQQFAQQVIDLVWDGDKYAINPAHLLFNHRREQRVPTLWNTFNTIQERVIRGGVRQYRRDGSRSTTRAVTAIDRSIKLNRAMWDVGEKFLQAWG